MKTVLHPRTHPSPLLAGLTKPLTSERRVPVRAHRRLARLFDAARQEELFSSPASFVLSFGVCFVGLGFGAYYYALWTLHFAT